LVGKNGGLGRSDWKACFLLGWKEIGRMTGDECVYFLPFPSILMTDWRIKNGLLLNTRCCVSLLVYIPAVLVLGREFFSAIGWWADHSCPRGLKHELSSNAGIVVSNPTEGMDVCLRLFYVCVALCAGRGLATGLSPVQGVLPTAYTGSRNWKSVQGQTKGCRVIIIIIIIIIINGWWSRIMIFKVINGRNKK
jgi:hypothetical protein